MKRIICIVFVMLFASIGFAAEDKMVIVKPCPKTFMVKDCLICHVMSDGKFTLRESSPDAHLIYPNTNMRVVDGIGYFYLTDIDSIAVKQFFDYLLLHKIKAAVFEIHSYGGSLFDGQRIVNMVHAWQSGGGTVEMRIYGMAFSAGFYVFVSGDNRLVSPYSDLMWHELQSFAGFGPKVTTPSDNEDAARVLRHLQNVRNAYLATRGRLTKAEIDAKVSKKEWWMTGAEAVAFGFADGFIKKVK